MDERARDAVHGVVIAALHVARNCGIPRAGALAGFGKEAEGSLQMRQCLGERMGETGRISMGKAPHSTRRSERAVQAPRAPRPFRSAHEATLSPATHVCEAR